MNENTNELICEFFKNEYIPIDNIPEDTALRDQICMEARASILLDDAPLSELARFFHINKSGSQLYLELPTPIFWDASYEVPNHSGQVITHKTKWQFKKYVIFPTWRREDCLGQTGRWRLAGVPDDFDYSLETETAATELLVESTSQISNKSYMLEMSKPKLQYKINPCLWRKHSIFEQMSPYLCVKTPQAVCYFFNNNNRPFAPLKLSGGLLRFNSSSTDGFEGERDWSKQYREMEESDAVHTYLVNSIAPSYLPANFFVGCSKTYDERVRFVFPFTDDAGYLAMIIVKTYHDFFQTKRLIPFTHWGQAGAADSYWLSIPHPKQQPLYNLHLLSQIKNPLIILTDSIEIAALNQARYLNSNIVFTSFICETEQYGQVDWSPLKDKKQIYYLLTNHSGKTFEQSCLEASRLADYLNSLSIKLLFIRMPVWYRPLPVQHNIRELISAYKAAKPQLYKEDIRILTPEEFETIRETAEQRIDMPPEAWWKTEREQKTSISFSSEEKPSTSDRFDYILWPLLIRGTSTMLYARKSLGKSALSHSIATCLCTVGKPRLFEENHWGASKGAWNSYKVLYLDFENRETGHKDLLKRVCNPYWRTEKVKQDEDSKNFIWKDMSKLGLAGINYALLENHQKILDILDAASDEGEPGHPVDVLVIDTYHEFTQLQDQVNTHQGLRTLLRTLNERNIATLIVNHPKPSDDSKMYGHGIILESFSYVMYLKRQGQDSKTLKEPMEVHFTGTREGWLGANPEPFKIYQPESLGRWHLYSPERPATEERNRIRDYYINVEKLGKEETAKLLGTSPASLYRPIKDED